MIRSSLRRKERVRSGIQREPAREFDRHRKFVRMHTCQACDGSEQIQCAHLRLETGGGTSLKPVDAWSLSLCAACHHIQTVTPEREFWRKLGKDPWRLCLKFALVSPVPEVKAYAREVMIPLIDRHAEYDARIAALFERESQ